MLVFIPWKALGYCIFFGNEKRCAGSQIPRFIPAFPLRKHRAVH